MSRIVRPLVAALVVGTALLTAPGRQAASEESGEATVRMVAFQLLPPRLEVETGTTVTWINEEPLDYPVVSGVHELVADDASFASPPFAPGTRWSHRFDGPGTFGYHCKFHQNVAGEIVVTGDPVAEEPREKEVTATEASPDDPESWSFDPGDLVIEAGTTVTWRNNGKNAHTVTADDGTFDSGELAPGSTWKRRFDEPGVFAYHCTPHPWMKATIRVVSPGGPAPEAPPPRPDAGPGTRPPAGETGGSAIRTGAGPVRHQVQIIEPNPARPMLWAFDPKVIDIRAGDTVVFLNAGNLQHTVTSDTPGLFDSGPLDPGETWEWTFDSPGSFAYHCTPHPWMKGVVRVVEATGEAPLAPLPAGTATIARAAAPRRSAASSPPMTGAGPSRVRVDIVEPDLTKALEWSFDPGVIEIRAGDTVVWHNTGSMQHTVTSDTPGLFDSGPLDPGKTWEWTFDSPGSFAYHCTPHPWMKGVVRVLDATGEAPVGVGGFAAGGEQAAGLPPAETAHDQGDESATAPLGRIADNGSPSSKFGLALVASAALIALTLFLAGVSPPRWPGDSTGRA